MNAFTTFIRTDWGERARRALLHSIWQFGVVAILLWPYPAAAEKKPAAEEQKTPQSDEASKEDELNSPPSQTTDGSAAHRATDLASPVRITAAGAPIDVDGFAAPFVGDFDEDGKIDLLVGQVGYGRLRIYRNAGTNARPKFDSFEWFAAGGHIAAVPVGCVVGFTPQLVDFDGDGRSDILTGSFMEGGLYLFRRNKDGTFAAAEVLENKQGKVRMGRRFPAYNSTVFLHDWDGDGDGDLVIGKHVRCLVLNEGTRQQPVFGDAVRLEIAGEPIGRGLVAPSVADWDGDGRDDLLAGRGNDIVWYRNTGKKGHPAFQKPKILIARDGWSSRRDRPGDGKPSRPQAICAADFNGDGRLDLLLGDHYFVKRSLTDEQLAQIAETSETARSLRTECGSLIRKHPENETREERSERFRRALRMWRELAEIPWTHGGLGDRADYKRHGSVWFYERIAVKR